jgi:hypothetical protein
MLQLNTCFHGFCLSYIWNSFPDQTPTPTRFLRNCDEEGLFDEIGENDQDDNPFDKVCINAKGPKPKSEFGI